MACTIRTALPARPRDPAFQGRSRKWALGDRLKLASREEIEQVAAEMGLKPNTLAAYRYQAAQIAPADRHPNVGFKAHAAVIGKPPAEQRHLLALIAAGKLTAKLRPMPRPGRPRAERDGQ